MTVRCTVCGENFKAWSDGEDMCGKCRVIVEDERRQAEAERGHARSAARFFPPVTKECFAQGNAARHLMKRRGGRLNVPYAERTCLRCAESTARTVAAKRANG